MGRLVGPAKRGTSRGGWARGGSGGGQRRQCLRALEAWCTCSQHTELLKRNLEAWRKRLERRRAAAEVARTLRALQRP